MLRALILSFRLWVQGHVERRGHFCEEWMEKHYLFMPLRNVAVTHCWINVLVFNTITTQGVNLAADKKAHIKSDKNLFVQVRKTQTCTEGITKFFGQTAGKSLCFSETSHKVLTLSLCWPGLQVLMQRLAECIHPASLTHLCAPQAINPSEFRSRIPQDHQYLNYDN